MGVWRYQQWTGRSNDRDVGTDITAMLGPGDGTEQVMAVQCAWRDRTILAGETVRSTSPRAVARASSGRSTGTTA
jgi:predicted helicase